MKTKLLFLQIPHSPTAAPQHRRVTRRTALTGVENSPLLVHRFNRVDQGHVSSTEPTDVSRQVVSDQHGDRRCPQRFTGKVRRTVRERREPALTAGNQLAGRVNSGDHVASNSTTRAPGPIERHGQPRVAHQGDARTRELHERQREPPEPRSVTQAGITSLAAEQVRGIGADGASTVDGYGTHKQPP